jgi:hypothetical protein
MATALPTDATWAISGRSESKLKEVAAACQALSPDRIQPGKEFQFHRYFIASMVM